jgi:hypothetical protein
MKRRVPKINVSGKIRDIKPGAENSSDFPNLQANRDKPPLFLKPDAGVRPEILRRPLWFKILAWVLLGCVALAVTVFGVGFYYLKYRLPKSLGKNVEELRSAAAELRLPAFESGDGRVGSFNPDISGLSDILGLFGEVQNFSQSVEALVSELRALGEDWPELILGGKGEELIARLKSVRGRLESLSGISERLQKFASFSPWGASYLPVQIDFLKLKDFLDSLIAWLDSEEPRRILILLQNPSELRPGGGFVGSYAEVELRRGSVAGMEVKDINDADRNSDLRIIPPRPLQLIATRWRAADANWFFDFSDSAEKILALFEHGEKYDAVLGVSAGVVGEILEITGPVRIESRKLTLNRDNFLVELQRQVQIGQAARLAETSRGIGASGGSPKEVLREFMPALINKILSLAEAQKNEIILRLGLWSERKDIQVKFREPKLQKFFEDLGVAGRMFQLPEPWNGDYLAVAYANIGGGKSDLYLKQKIVLQSQINAEGTLNNHLVIYREHRGQESEYWWYRVPSQGYLKIFVPRDAKLVYARGGIKKTISPKINYAALGYFQDPLVAAVEETRETHPEFPEVERFWESGKRVFGIWSKTDLGKTAEIVFDYSRRLPFIPAAGAGYEFVFERQSGAVGEYFFQISAPVGFRFRENGLPVFEYQSSDPPARLILKLTLEKI